MTPKKAFQAVNELYRFGERARVAVSELLRIARMADAFGRQAAVGMLATSLPMIPMRAQRLILSRGADAPPACQVCEEGFHVRRPELRGRAPSTLDAPRVVRTLRPAQ